MDLQRLLDHFNIDVDNPINFAQVRSCVCGEGGRVGEGIGGSLQLQLHCWQGWSCLPHSRTTTAHSPIHLRCCWPPCSHPIPPSAPAHTHTLQFDKVMGCVEDLDRGEPADFKGQCDEDFLLTVRGAGRLQRWLAGWGLMEA